MIRKVCILICALLAAIVVDGFIFDPLGVEAELLSLGEQLVNLGLIQSGRPGHDVDAIVCDESTEGLGAVICHGIVTLLDHNGPVNLLE